MGRKSREKWERLPPEERYRRKLDRAARQWERMQQRIEQDGRIWYANLWLSHPTWQAKFYPLPED